VGVRCEGSVFRFRWWSWWWWCREGPGQEKSNRICAVQGTHKVLYTVTVTVTLTLTLTTVVVPLAA